MEIVKELKALGAEPKFRGDRIVGVGLYHGRFVSRLIEVLEAIEGLETLLFYCTELVDEDLALVSSLTNIHTLGLLSCFRITDKGLLNLKNMRTLKRLSVLGTSVTEEGAQDLVNYLPNLEIYGVAPTEADKPKVVRGREA